MKKHFSLLLAVLMLCICLAGCVAKETTAPHSYEDLTIRIPADFPDLSDADFAQGFSFVFGLDPIAVNGLREEKATFRAYGLEPDIRQYGEWILAANHVSAELSQKDGIWTFSYPSGDYTYLVTLWETRDAFWTVQAYCPTVDFPRCEQEMWQILSSVTVN